MFEKSLTNIPESYYISNKKIYTRIENNYTISNVEKFDAEKFAEWMQKGFSSCPVKTYAALAREVKSNPATISRLINGSPQTTNGKPSQPDKNLVERLALYFKTDVDDAVVLAGYAPKNKSKIPAPILDAIDRNDNLTEQHSELVANFIDMLGKQGEKEKHEMTREQIRQEYFPQKADIVPFREAEREQPEITAEIIGKIEPRRNRKRKAG